MADLEVKIHSDNVITAMRLFPVTFARYMRGELWGLGEQFWRKAGKAFGAQSPHKQRLARFWFMDRIGKYLQGKYLSQVEMGLFTHSPAMEAHEQGALISANSGSLAIPIADALDRLGRVRTRFNPGKRFKLKGEGGFDTRLLPSDTEAIPMRGKLFLVKKDSYGEVAEIYARLVKETRLRARPSFFKTWDQMGPAKARAINKAAERTLRKMGLSTR